MQKLAKQLHTVQTDFAQKAPQEVQNIMETALNKLSESGILSRVKKAGDPAPDFSLPNALGESVHLQERLAAGNVILAFYRGHWCPYCNLQLKVLQEYMPKFSQRNASLIAVSPLQPDNTLTLQEKYAIQFDVLSDVGNTIAKKYGLVYRLDEDIVPVYKQFGIDLEKANGENTWELPLTPTYVIDQQGIIQYAHISVDYRIRMEPEDILHALDKL